MIYYSLGSPARNSTRMMARKEEGGLSTPGVAQWTWRLIIERSDWYAYVCAVIKWTVWSPVQSQTYMPSLLAAIHGTLIPDTYISRDVIGSELLGWGPCPASREGHTRTKRQGIKLRIKKRRSIFLSNLQASLV